MPTVTIARTEGARVRIEKHEVSVSEAQRLEARTTQAFVADYPSYTCKRFRRGQVSYLELHAGRYGVDIDIDYSQAQEVAA